jgi:hypothetical protein
MAEPTFEEGCYVDPWYGQYTTARALNIALELGWEPIDHDVILALVATKLDTMAPSTTLTESTKALREDAGLPREAPDNEEIEFLTLDEYLQEALDEAEEYLDNHERTPEHYSWRSYPYGMGWGMWLDEDLRVCDECGKVTDAGDYPDWTNGVCDACE